MSKRSIAIAAVLCIAASRPHPAPAQMPVYDNSNFIQLGIDFALQKLRRVVVRQTRREAFHHYRRVTQYVGVDVFISGAPRAALTATAPASPKKAYAELYAPAYAAGVPERVQDSLAAERITLMQHRNLATLDSIQYVIAHLQQQVETLGEELERRLTRPAAAAPEGANRQGDVAQLKAAIGAKTAQISALQAQAVTLQGRTRTEQQWYAAQQRDRALMRTQRAAAQNVGPELSAPRIAHPRYRGARKFLRFPGHRGQ